MKNSIYALLFALLCLCVGSSCSRKAPCSFEKVQKWYDEEDLEAALLFLEKVKCPSKTEYYFWKGRILNDMGNEIEAKENFLKFVENPSPDPEQQLIANLELGIMASMNEAPEEALGYLNQAKTFAIQTQDQDRLGKVLNISGYCLNM